MLLNLFLGHAEEQRVQLYDRLFRDSTHNLTVIAQRLGWTYQQAYYVYKQLPPEFQVGKSLSPVPTELTERLVKSSLAYQALYNAYATHLPVSDLIQTLNCSVPILRRRMVKLKHYLQRLDLKYQFNEVRLEGDERQIRLFYWYLFAAVSEKLTLDRVQLGDRILKTLLGRDLHSCELPVVNLLVIFFQRIDEGKLIKPTPPQIDDCNIPLSLVSACASELNVDRIQMRAELTWLHYILTVSPYVQVNETTLRLADVHLAENIYRAFIHGGNPRHELYLAAIIAYSRHEQLPLISDDDEVQEAQLDKEKVHRVVAANLDAYEVSNVALITENIINSLALDADHTLLQVYITPKLPVAIKDHIIIFLNSTLNHQINVVERQEDATFLILLNRCSSTDQQIYYWSLGLSRKQNLLQLLVLLNHYSATD
ncbi:helix-turn-helix domain-containing protein [Loigolactobacillus binensis]|uniref:Helix-turn-helix domain-containing protein n=1 Tax=Loigolactobacillus binensis TaxID=2559922 RepID=A0ABW3EEV5_9LACO|nr:helix-turn-helix domain-containing protein [Loigolactobacillus binensis]